MLDHPIRRKLRNPATGKVEVQTIAQGLTRRVINKHICRIRRMFAWAVEEELLPVEVHQRLLRVKGLKKGKTAARERPRIRPIPAEHIDAVLPLVPPMIRAMIEIQRLCGCRSQNICQMRGCEIERQGNVWEYRPASYKTEHLNEEDDPERDRVIYLGPQAQQLLQPWLPADANAYVFSPRRSEELRNQARRQQRQTKLWPSHERQQRRNKKPYSLLRDQYDNASYRRAVRRVCLQARIPIWTPKRLRHTRLTEIRRGYGLEASKACAGHREIGVTQHYAEQDRSLARQVMEQTG
jgi:integrase